MPYPSPLTYPSPALYPGFGLGGGGRIAVIGDLVLGMTDPDGVKWSLNDVDGWEDSPESTVEVVRRARAHGATTTEPFMAERYMTVEGHITAPTPELLSASMAKLRAAVTLQPFQFLVSEPGGGVRNVQAQRKGAVLVPPITDTMASYSALIMAKDPRKYGDLDTRSTNLPSSSGGLVYPVTYPVTYTGVSNTGIIRINNPGDAEAPVWLRIDGPIPAGGWTVTHVGKRRSLAFQTSLALGAGEFVTVDMDRREVLAQGQSARAGYVTSRGWFTLNPGDNEIAFSAQNYSATALLTVTTKPAWS